MQIALPEHVRYWLDVVEDEDLISAVYNSMDDANESKWGRNRFDAVATTLPSSHSRQLDGRVAIADIRALLELLIISSVDRTLSAREVEGTLETLTTPLSLDGNSVDWNTFNRVVGVHMVSRHCFAFPAW
jgi:hypothetical protein